MGKCSINSCDAGRASIIYERGHDHLDDLIDQIDKTIVKMDAALALAAAKEVQVKALIDEAVSQIDAMISSYATCTSTHGDGAQNPTCQQIAKNIATAQKSIADESAYLKALRDEIAAVKAQKAAIQHRRNLLTAERDKAGTMDVWVADFTEGGENPAPALVAGTIEVWGNSDDAPEGVNRPTRKILLRPMFDASKQAYNAARDAMVTGPLNSEAAMVYSHWATWAWVQEHRPRYITARITSIDRTTHLASVMRTVPLGHQSIAGVTYGATQTSVPFHYRECRSWAFKVGDRVIVEYGQINKQEPSIIGFEDSPRNCKISGWTFKKNAFGGGRLLVYSDAETDFEDGGGATTGNCSWWSEKTGDVVTWWGDRSRYGYALPANSANVFFRGAGQTAPSGIVRGACTRKIGADRWLYVIVILTGMRQDRLYRKNLTANGAWQTVWTLNWDVEYAYVDSSIFTSCPGTVCFSEDGLSAVVCRHGNPDGANHTDSPRYEIVFDIDGGTRTVTDMLAQAQFRQVIASHVTDYNHSCAGNTSLTSRYWIASDFRGNTKVQLWGEGSQASSGAMTMNPSGDVVTWRGDARLQVDSSTEVSTSWSFTQTTSVFTFPNVQYAGTESDISARLVDLRLASPIVVWDEGIEDRATEIRTETRRIAGSSAQSTRSLDITNINTIICSMTSEGEQVTESNQFYAIAGTISPPDGARTDSYLATGPGGHHLVSVAGLNIGETIEHFTVMPISTVQSTLSISAPVGQVGVY